MYFFRCINKTCEFILCSERIRIEISSQHNILSPISFVINIFLYSIFKYINLKTFLKQYIYFSSSIHVDILLFMIQSVESNLQLSLTFHVIIVYSVWHREESLALPALRDRALRPIRSGPCIATLRD